MTAKLLVFDTHPVPYRIPLWQEITRRHPGMLHVVYASDFIIRGHTDEHFGTKVIWDEPMLAGYESTVLNCERGEPFSSWGWITGEGVADVIKKHKPEVIFLMGINFKYEMVAYLTALRMGIPLWLRCETQDFSAVRSKKQALFRSLVYRLLYPAFRKIFYIGEYNKMHYRAHGVRESKLIPARYCTPDRITKLTDEEKIRLRDEQRETASIRKDALVVGFAGKLIEKKNPKILYHMLEFLPDEVRRRVHIYFMGSGELEGELKELAASAEQQYGIKTYFSGFINQTQLPAHYLSMDIMVLPSRRMGETWGLVSNEAMQAGASVVVSNAVGCSGDFKSWEQFRVFPEGDPKQLAEAINSLAHFPRTFDWARTKLQDYSSEAAAQAIISAMAAK